MTVFSIEEFLKKAKQLDGFASKEYEEFVGFYRAHAKAITPKSFGLRLVVVSDTHGDLAFGDSFLEFMRSVKHYDFVILLGDMYPREVEKILEIIPQSRIVTLRGNHDAWDTYEKYGLANVHGRCFSYKGVRFAGMEGSFRYKNEDFPGFTHYESLCTARALPAPCDVLLTHDRMFTTASHDLAHAGLAGIAYYIYENAPSLHIHGHIHKSYRENYENGTVEKSVYGVELIKI